MNKIREAIRLHEKCSLSQRQISKALSISRPSVKEYTEKIKGSGLNYKDIQAMTDEALLEILRSRPLDTKPREILQAKFKEYAKELKRVGVTKQILWEEYKQQSPNGYSYSQFCYYFHEWEKNSDVEMRFEYKAGDKLFVDFTGKKLKIIDRYTGEIQEVEIFVAILAASQLTYVEAVTDQKKESWIKATDNALQYIGGVPKAIVPDNLKSAVTKADKYEPDINPEYYDFSLHYNTSILPTRPYKPRDKGMVEGAVKIVYSWIFARLRDEVFYSIDELNRAIRDLLEDYNARKMQKMDISRRDLFNEIERDVLKPLPIERYELKKYKTLKVQFNYHVYLCEDKHYYSVPYRYKGKHVSVLYTDRTVEIYQNNVRIAFHRRNGRKNGYTTVKEHMPPKHRWKDNWDPDKLIDWAESLGSAVKDIIDAVLGSKKHPEQMYKTCMGILNLSKKYGNIRLNKACKRAIYYEKYSYKFIKNMLENRTEDMGDDDSCNTKIPYHKNIRGNNYYNNKGGYDEQSVYN